MHEVAAIFVRDESGRYLFFERVKFPFGFTVPAGHIEMAEQPLTAAIRELWEETGITGLRMQALGVDDIADDVCRRGHQGHRWHSFIGTSIAPLHVKVNSEGRDPVWLTPGGALERDLTIATRYTLAHHRKTLQ